MTVKDKKVNFKLQDTIFQRKNIKNLKIFDKLKKYIFVKTELSSS